MNTPIPIRVPLHLAITWPSAVETLVSRPFLLGFPSPEVTLEGKSPRAREALPSSLGMTAFWGVTGSDRRLGLPGTHRCVASSDHT